MELITYNFASLYESLGKTLNTPWELRWAELSCFPVISAWVRELKGPEARDMRNWIAHGFNCGSYYRDIEGNLESGDVGEGMAGGAFSVIRLWRLLESEVPPFGGRIGVRGGRAWRADQGDGDRGAESP
jgi:hypothetical protein